MVALPKKMDSKPVMKKFPSKISELYKVEEEQ